MKRNILLIVVFIVSLGASIQSASAQTDSCIIQLKNANTGYDKGDYDGTIKLLKTALTECNLSKEDKIQANKLLILSYLKVDNLEDADKTAGEIMKIDPYYKPDKFKDDPKLSALFIKYKPTPKLRLGFYGGINFSSIDEVQSYSIVHDNDAEGLDTYNGQMGFQLGAFAEYKAYKSLWVELGFMYRQSKYEHILDSIEGSTVNYSEKLSYFDVPLSLKYYFTDGMISPYIEGGATFSFLTDALSTTTRESEEDLVNRKEYRNDFGVGFFGGAGVVYKMKALQLFTAVRYSYYPDNVNEEGTRYSDPVNVFKYYYIDDDFRMDNLQINVGVSYTLSYKNQKLK